MAADIKLEFERFRLLPTQRQLLEDGVAVRIGSRAFDILNVLALAGGELVTTRDLFDQVWPESTVDQNTLRVHVAALRAVLGHNSAGKSFVINIAGRGYQLGAEVRRLDAPDSRVMDARSPIRPIPIRVSQILGRDDTISLLASELGTRQFITVVGFGGIGKTTVALAVAERCKDLYDNIAFVDLGLLPPSSHVGQAVALAVGLTMDVDDTVPVLTALFEHTKTLIILDNCEHLISSAALFSETLFRSAPNIALLCTSREPLRASGEWVYRLKPLRVPPAGRESETAESAMSHSAVQFFVHRAKSANIDFALGETDIEAVCEICRKLDGIPLAIELAASWSDMYGVRALAANLNEIILSQGLGRRGAADRHTSLRATMKWSYGLLALPEQRLLRRLSVFAGEFSLEAAMVVGGDAEESEDRLRYALAELVQKNLVNMRSSNDQALYHLLEAPRAFARETLSAAGELDTVRRQHLLWVLDQLNQAKAAYRPAARRQWLRDHVTLLDETRGAAFWSLTEGCAPDLAIELGFRAVVLWFHFSRNFEAREFLEAVQARSATAPGRSDLEDMRLRTALGVSLMFTRAPNAEVVSNWQVVLRLADANGDSRVQMMAQCGLWLMASFRTDFGAAGLHARAFAALAQAEGSRDDIATAARLEAGIQFSLGELDRAREACNQALTASAEPDAGSGAVFFHFDLRSQILGRLSKIDWLQGRFDDALANAQLGIDAAQQSGHDLSVGFAILDGLAQLAIWLGDAPLTQKALDRFITMPEGRGLRASEAVDVMGAAALAQQGEITQAADIVARVFSQPSGLVILGRFPSLTGRFADILGEAGQFDEAVKLVGAATRWEDTERGDVMSPELMRARGRLLVVSGDTAGAAACYRDASRLAERHGSVAWQLRIAIDHLTLVRGTAEETLARRDLESVVSRLGPGDSSDLRRAAQLLAA
ncbi:ATP-binding protein [Sphingomonas glacialis]|uniref:OmpR/PhoB-type domain-containing protein n=1 Tax=Sphingomonas glacialis TaxID=658225 RepID=A0A502G5S9_9SPHN|nr:winged helix-turn-helix domain-containing protein [Sphingomonas glacialis]TPG56556.1 hypothetical protein EAH76_03210 [Sphingomonas glacialis]